ncbi:MAG TPA: hypothetical protein VHJ20_14260 [Polyangia bacterium]|nr:hypothetical protein [Polyangia bacterium]
MNGGKKNVERVSVGALALAVAIAAGCDGNTVVGNGPPPPVVTSAGPASGLAVLGGDFTASVVSLLNADGTLAKDDCLDSGSATSATLALALSGDVTLPSQPQHGGKLWIVDRGNSALTVLEPTTCAPITQISVSTGYVADPHDVVVLSDTKAYATRYNKNAAAKDAMSTGDDVIIFDPSTGALTGRIDLSAQASQVAGAMIQARPDRMAVAGGKVFVTLNDQDAMFHAAGEGAVVVIDPQTDVVTSRVALTDMKGCEGLAVVEDAKRLFVACGGSFSDADQAAGSGVAEIDIGASPPALVSVTKASALDGHPVNFSWVGAASATQLFAATFGSFGDAKSNTPATNDAVFSFAPGAAAGAGKAIGLEDGAFSLGRAAVSTTLLVVPDSSAAAPRVHVLSIPATGTPTETTAFDADPAKKLAPIEIAFY